METISWEKFKNISSDETVEDIINKGICLKADETLEEWEFACVMQDLNEKSQKKVIEIW